MVKKIKDFLYRKNLRFNEMHEIVNNLNSDIKSPKINLGKLQATLNGAKVVVENLSEVEFQVFSQFGDDGIIQYLIEKLPIKNKTFIEFGVENYKESNTRFLLVNNAWSGLVLDGSSENINTIKNSRLYSFYDLRAIDSFITKENINEIIAKAGFQKEIGVLSVDIDGNDYWVLDAINTVEADILICEYNSLFGFNDAVTIPYKADFVRGVSTPLNFYGASLKSLQMLAQKKGYFFIGCNSAGNNAYFINEKHRSCCPVSEKSSEAGYNLAMFSETWDANKEPKRGAEKLRSIEGQIVIDVTTLESRKWDAEPVVNALKQSNKFKGIH
jgi:hypothetical protein